MFFSNFVCTNSVSEIIFKNTSPIKNVGSLKFYKDNSSEYFLKKEFRWSFNNQYWSSWQILSQGNLSKININNNPYFYMQIRYIKSNSSSFVSIFSINYIESSIIISNNETKYNDLNYSV